MTEQTKTRIPAPLYAAAGAGDAAYQQLRKLPAVVEDLREKAPAALAELRERTMKLRDRAVATDLDADRLRGVAKRNAAVVVAGAQAAQERAVAFYTQLVARGERVVGGGVVQAADVVNADIETTVPAELTGTPADIARTSAPAKKAVKKAARPAAR